MDNKSTTPIGEFSRQLERFLRLEAASGVVLILFTLIAIIWANSPFSTSYFALLHTDVSVAIGSFSFRTTFLHIVNDAIMCVFFFIIGLELKREFVEGELKNPREATLPILAAIGGMAFPALIFLLFADDASQKGWAIPAATDIAFAVGIMALLSDKISQKLKVFLLTLAVADDIGAIIIIALFYSHGFDVDSLILCVAMLALMVILYKVGIRHLFVFFAVAIFAWSFILASGIHSTILGVVLGLMAPSSPDIKGQELRSRLEGLKIKISSLLEAQNSHEKAHASQDIAQTSYEAMSMLQKLELYFHPWNIFYVLPLFALFNAGFIFDANSLATPLSFAIICGLMIGKPLGIITMSYIAKYLGVVKLEFSFRELIGIGFLAGIGFTMSIFISALAFGESPQNEISKGAIFMASLLSGFLGYLILKFHNKMEQS